MNKTYNMNLGGMPFQIDDEAFEKLNSYLDAVKRKFSQVQGNEEIVEDIEARMAEMFQENLGATSRKIVSLRDVDGAIEAMGRPEEFDQGFEDDEDFAGASRSTGAYTVGRKLYRDPDDKVLGGVISGLSQYFGLESPRWLRVAWAGLPIIDLVFFGWMFSGGIPTTLLLLTYVGLWIALPKALTPTQKMQMRGEPVNLDNIQRKFSDGVDNVKRNFNEPNTRNARRDFGEVLGAIAKGFGKLILAFGLFLAAIIGLVLLIAFFGAIFGLGTVGPMLSMTFFGNNWMGWAFAIGLLLMLFALPIFIISLFIKILFKTKTNMPAIAFGTLGAFLLGFILTTVSGINFAKEFSNTSSVRETTNLQPVSEFYLYGENDSNWDNDDFTIGIDESLFKENVDLKIINTRDSMPSLIIQKKARGRTTESAKGRAESIDYSVDVDSNSLTFSEALGYKKKDLWRNQSVDAILRIPENTIIHFDESLSGVLQKAEIHGKDIYSWKLIDKGTWKYTDNTFYPLDSEGNPIVDYDKVDDDWDSDEETDGVELRWKDGESFFSVDEKSENVDIKVFGKEVFKLDVTERDAQGDPKRVNIRIGDKDAIQIEVDDNGKVIEID